MDASKRFIRRTAMEGNHLFTCMASPDHRAAGWRMIQRARRMARRLGFDLRELGVTL